MSYNKKYCKVCGREAGIWAPLCSDCWRKKRDILNRIIDLKEALKKYETNPTEKD